MRTIAVGDIHGCAKALRSLLEALQPTPEDCIVFLGDYVDRGPDSKGVISQLLELRERCQTVFLLGNHEIMFRGALRGLEPELWLDNGGRQTVTSYGGRLDYVSRDHIEFLENCLPYFETDKHIFVHANLSEDLPLREQTEHTLFWEHLSARIPGPHHSGKHVFCGHTPQPYGAVGSFGHLTCLDTGCVGGYWLTALDVDSREMWQVSREGHLKENWKIVRKCWSMLRRVTLRPASQE